MGLPSSTWSTHEATAVRAGRSACRWSSRLAWRRGQVLSTAQQSRFDRPQRCRPPVGPTAQGHTWATSLLGFYVFTTRGGGPATDCHFNLANLRADGEASVSHFDLDQYTTSAREGGADVRRLPALQCQYRIGTLHPLALAVRVISNPSLPLLRSVGQWTGQEGDAIVEA